MNSGISITTGGTTISAVLRLSRTSRPKKRMRAIAYAASAAQPVLITHDPTARMTLFLNQVRNDPPRVALPKLSSEIGHGSEYGFDRY